MLSTFDVSDCESYSEFVIEYDYMDDNLTRIAYKILYGRK